MKTPPEVFGMAIMESRDVPKHGAYFLDNKIIIYSAEAIRASMVESGLRRIQEGLARMEKTYREMEKTYREMESRLV